jgi:hypothetical protein
VSPAIIDLARVCTARLKTFGVMAAVVFEEDERVASSLRVCAVLASRPDRPGCPVAGVTFPFVGAAAGKMYSEVC